MERTPVLVQGLLLEAGFEHANAGQLKMVEGPWILLKDQILVGLGI